MAQSALDEILFHLPNFLYIECLPRKKPLHKQLEDSVKVNRRNLSLTYERGAQEEEIKCSVKIDEVELGVGCDRSKFLAKKGAVETTVKVLKSLYPVIIEKENKGIRSRMVFNQFTEEDDVDTRISQEIESFSRMEHGVDKLVLVGFEAKRDRINLLSFDFHVKATSRRDIGVIELTKERDYVGIYNELMTCENFENDEYQLIFPEIKTYLSLYELSLFII